MSVEVEVVRGATDEVVEAVSRLLPQLSRSADVPDRESVARLLCSDANTLLLARVEGRAVGMLTLIMFPLPSGLRGRIEDVVVDEAARGHGVGVALTEEALRLAEAAGVRTVDLTSRPSRQAANRIGCTSGWDSRPAIPRSTGSGCGRSRASMRRAPSSTRLGSARDGEEMR
ncbi:GNAT family N-acetyltransferase [Streptomyces gelaticus]